MIGGTAVVGYWIPLQGSRDLYVHLGLDSAEQMAKAAAAKTT